MAHDANRGGPSHRPRRAVCDVAVTRARQHRPIAGSTYIHHRSSLALAAALSVIAFALIGAVLLSAPVAFAASCSDSWLNPASGSWTTATNWSTGVVPTSSDDVCIQVAGTYTVTLPASASVDSLTLGDSSGTGTQTLLVSSASGSSPTLTVANDSAIEATGQLELESPVSEPSVGLSAPSTATVTDDGDLLVTDDGGPADYLRADLMVGGSGSVEVAGALIQDQGTVTTNDGSFGVDATGSLSLTSSAGSFVNGGSVVSDGSVKLAGDASWTQDAPGAAVQSGTPVEIFNSGALDDVSGAGSFDLVDSAVLSGVVPVGQTVTAEAFTGHNANIHLASSVTNDGSLVLDEPAGSANESGLTPAGSTLVNNGTITARTEESGSTANYLEANVINDSTGSLTVASGTLLMDQGTTLTSAGSLTIAAGATFSATSSAGLIVNDAAGQAALANSGTFELAGNASFTQNGTESGNPVEIFNSGTLDDQSGSGGFDLVDSARLEGTVPVGQTVTAEAFTGHNANIDLIDSPVTNDGTLVLDEPAGSANQSGLTPAAATLINNGTITAQTEETGSIANYLEANLTNNAGATVQVTSGTLLMDQGTTLTSAGTLTIATGAAFSATSSAGLIVNDATGQNALANSGTFKLAGDASFTQNGTETGNPVEIFNSGLLDDEAGTGSFDLVDSAILEGTIVSGQTVTAEAFPGHNAFVEVVGTVTNDGQVVLDSPSGGGNAGLVASSVGTPEVDNFGQLTSQTESGDINYLRVDLVDEAASTVAVASGTLTADQGFSVSNGGTFTTDAQIGAGPVPTFTMTSSAGSFTNTGSVVDDGLVTLIGDASWTQDAPAAATQSGNPVEIFNSGTLDDQSGSGGFDLVDSARLEGTVPVGQTVTAEAFTGHNANIDLIDSPVTNDGTLVLDEPAGSANESGLTPAAATLINNGTITAQTEETGSIANYLEANLTNNAGATVQVTSGTLLMDQGTTLTSAGTLTIATGAAFSATSSAGLIVNDATGQNALANSGTFKLAGDASFTQNGTETGNPVEIFNSGLLDDEAGTGSFDLVDSARLEGTVPAGQTVTAEAFTGHNANITLINPPVTNNGAIVLDEPAGSANYSDISPATATLVNNGTITTQTEETGSTPNYLEANLTNNPTGTLTVATGTLLVDQGTTTLNHGLIEITPAAQLNLTSSAASLINEANGTIQPDIAGPTTFGTINLTGDATFNPGGTLAVNLVGGYAPPIGTEFNVITTTGMYSGGFAAVTNSFTGDYSQPHVITVERGPDATATAVGAAPSAPTAGQQVTLTATITAGPGAIGNPTGEVAFTSGATILGMAPVTTAAGISTAQSVVTEPAGVYQVVAAYSGAPNFAASVSSPPLDLTVAAGGSSTTTTTTTTTGTTTTGTTTTTTPAATGTTTTTTGATPTPAGALIAAPPVLAASVDAAPVSGQVLVQLPGTSRFVPLSSLRSVPVGSTIDATHGSVTITAATPGGGTETGTFFDGEFILRQTRSGELIAVLTGGSFAACSQKTSKTSKTRQTRQSRKLARIAAATKRPPKKIRSLWANVHGNFSTQGAYGSAAVSGTEWLTEDRCDGTYFRVTRHRIIVTSFKLHNHKTVVSQGHSYLAPAG